LGGGRRGGEGWGCVGIFIGSQWVPQVSNVFPTMLPITPHFVVYALEGLGFRVLVLLEGI